MVEYHAFEFIVLFLFYILLLGFSILNLMRTFFWLCFLLLIPGLLFRIGLGGSGILGVDILLPVFAFFWIFKKGIVDRDFPEGVFLKPGFVFLGIAFLSFLLGAGDLLFKEQVLSGAYLLRFFSLLVFGWAAVDLFRTKREQEKLFKGVFMISGVVVGLGFLQFYFLPDISFLSTEGGWDPHMGRLLGTWMDPNFVAGFLGFMMPVALGKWYDSQSSKERFWLMVLIVLFGGALFLTFSRSGYLAAGVGLGFFFLLRDPKIILIGMVLVGVGLASHERAQKRVGELMGTISALVLRNTDEIDPTASLRLKSWRDSFTLFQKYPVLGIGFNTYRYRAAEEGIVDENYFSSGGADSSLLTVLVTTGVVGFVVYLWFWGGLFWGALCRYRLRFDGSGKRNAFALGGASGVLALVVHSFFVNSLLFPLILMPTFVIMAVNRRS